MGKGGGTFERLLGELSAHSSGRLFHRPTKSQSAMFFQRIVLTDAGAVALSGQLANVSLLPISLLLFGGPERLT